MAIQRNLLATAAVSLLALSVSGCRIVYQTPAQETVTTEFVDVTGVLNGPAQIPIPPTGLTLFQAVARAGGLEAVPAVPGQPAPPRIDPTPGSPGMVETAGPGVDETAPPAPDGALELGGSPGTEDVPMPPPPPVAAAEETKPADQKQTVWTASADDPIPFVALRRRAGMVTTRWIFPLHLVASQTAGSILLREGDIVSILSRDQTPLKRGGLSVDAENLFSSSPSVQILQSQDDSSLVRDMLILPEGSVMTDVSRLTTGNVNYDLSVPLRLEQLPPVAASLVTSSFFDMIDRKAVAQAQRRGLNIPLISPLVDAVGSGIRNLSTIELVRSQY